MSHLRGLERALALAVVASCGCATRLLDPPKEPDAAVDLAALSDLASDGRPAIDLALPDLSGCTVPSYPTGRAPNAVAIGDLDSDGIADLVVVDSFDNSVSVLRGLGNGSFAARVDYPTAVGPNAVVIGDFNGDGKLDIAVTDIGSCSKTCAGGDHIDLLINKGDGTFASAVGYPTGSRIFSLAAGDLDGDGSLDLAVTNFEDRTVSVLRNHGDGTFAPRVNYFTGAGPWSVAIADFDSDGKLDIAVANSGGCTLKNVCSDSSTISVLLNQGDGLFSPRVDYQVGSSPGSLAAGDLNGDGHPDLAVISSGILGMNERFVSVLLNQGKGKFGPKTDYPVAIIGSSLSIRDINGDGRLDLAVTEPTSGTAQPGVGGAVALFFNQGGGTFGPRVEYRTCGFPISLDLADLNSDGKLDLAVTTYDNTVELLLSPTY